MLRVLLCKPSLEGIGGATKPSSNSYVDPAFEVSRAGEKEKEPKVCRYLSREGP